MNNMLLRLYVLFQDLKSREDGQDLVEYALTVAMLGFSAIAGMQTLAAGLSNAFTNISTTLASDL
jgi:Flp pilus assembly pilin Flp